MDSPALYDPPGPGKGMPKRWEMVLLLFSGIMVVYTLRVNISVAAQDMRDDLHWSEAQKGLVLSAFYWGYALGQIPAARFVQTYGAKWIFGFSVLIPSALTLLVPAACKQSFGLALFVRAIIGFFESASFPAVFHFFPIWIPLKEKTFLIPMIYGGMYMGEILGFSLSGLLVSSTIEMDGISYPWEWVFYLFGLWGIVWFPLWAMYAYERPEDHPGIDREELMLIGEGKHHHHPLPTSPDDTKRTPLLAYSDYRAAHTPDISAANPQRGSVSSVVYDMNRDSDANTEPRHTMGSAKVMVPDDEEDGVVNPMEELRSVDFNPHDAYEAVYLDEERRLSICSAPGASTDPLIPWKAFATNKHSLCLFINSWAFGFIGFTLLSEMPSFLTDELNFSLSSAGIMSSFPYLGLFIVTLSFGKLGIHMQTAWGWEVDTVRQIANWTAFVGAGGGLLIAGYLADPYAAYAFVIISQSLLGAVQSGVGCAYSDVSPNYSSSLNSVGNTIGAIAGIAGPLIVSACLDENPGIVGWRVAFFITAGFAAIALAFWSKLQTSKIVDVLNTPCAKEDSCF